MTDAFADQIADKISQAAALYYRLVLIVGPTGSGTTPALRAVGDRTGAPLTNVSLELSLQMLNMTARQRTLQLRQLLEGIVENDVEPQATALLDNTEILFCADLEQDPLRSVAAPPGSVAKQDGRRLLEWHHRRRRPSLRDSGPSGTQTLPGERIPGGKPGG